MDAIEVLIQCWDIHQARVLLINFGNIRCHVENRPCRISHTVLLGMQLRILGSILPFPERNKRSQRIRGLIARQSAEITINHLTVREQVPASTIDEDGFNGIYGNIELPSATSNQNPLRSCSGIPFQNRRHFGFRRPHLRTKGFHLLCNRLQSAQIDVLHMKDLQYLDISPRAVLCPSNRKNIFSNSASCWEIQPTVT